LEKKEEGIVARLLSLFGVTQHPIVYSIDNPRITRTRDGLLEAFPYDGYDVEIREETTGGFHLSVHLKGECCLIGWFFSAQDWAMTVPTTSHHLVSYRTREDLKQYALKRMNKE